MDEHEFIFPPTALHYMQGSFPLLAEMGGTQASLSLCAPTLRQASVPTRPTTRGSTDGRSAYGANVFPQPEMASFFELCKDILSDPMLIVLIIAGTVSIALGLADSLGHGWYEGASHHLRGRVWWCWWAPPTSGSSRSSSPTSTAPRRPTSSPPSAPAKSQQIHPDAVLVGDVVLLSAGNFIPADGIIVADDSYQGQREQA